MGRRRLDDTAAHSASGDEWTAELDHNVSGALRYIHIIISLLRETGSAACSLFLLAASAAAGVCGVSAQQGAQQAHMSEQNLINRLQNTSEAQEQKLTHSILLLNCISEGNTVHFTSLHLSDN